MNINLTINGQVLSATLEDNSAARDFLGLLPLTLHLELRLYREDRTTVQEALHGRGTSGNDAIHRRHHLLRP